MVFLCCYYDGLQGSLLYVQYEVQDVSMTNKVCWLVDSLSVCLSIILEQVLKQPVNPWNKYKTDSGQLKDVQSCLDTGWLPGATSTDTRNSSNNHTLNNHCFNNTWFQQDLISTWLGFSKTWLQQDLCSTITVSTILGFNMAWFQQDLASTRHVTKHGVFACVSNNV